MRIIDELLAVFLKDARAVSILRQHGVTPATYVAYVYDDELRRARQIGYVIGFILVVGLFFLSFFASEASVSTVKAQWFFGLGGAALGFFIAWGAMRRMEGKRWRYLDEPDEMSSAFSLIGIMHRFSPKFLQKIDDPTWVRLRAYRPDFSSKHYHHLPTQPKSTAEKVKMMQMTPAKKKLVVHLERVQLWSGYSMLFIFITPFVESLFFLFWFWFFFGVWLALEAVLGIVQRHIGVLSDTTTIDLYGWPARVFAWFLLFIAFVLFVIPGVLGMLGAVHFNFLTFVT